MWWPGGASFLQYVTIVLTGIPWIYEVVKYLSQKPTKDIEQHKDDSLATSEYEVVMFREDGYECRIHCHQRSACEKPECAYRCVWKMCNIIGHAVESLDICVCFITCEDLIGSVLLASQRGARVRVITDGHMMEFNANLQILQNYGIPVHKVKSDNNMHHKFALVDNKVLIEGSANWTVQAFSGNWENIIITSHKALCQRFADIFTQLWDSLEQEEKGSMFTL